MVIHVYQEPPQEGKNVPADHLRNRMDALIEKLSDEDNPTNPVILSKLKEQRETLKQLTYVPETYATMIQGVMDDIKKGLPTNILPFPIHQNSPEVKRLRKAAGDDQDPVIIQISPHLPSQ